MAAWLLALAITASPPPTQSIHFDRIDIHHLHCAETGEHRFSQLVFWRWSREDRRFFSFGFKIIKDGQMLPRFDGHCWTVEVKRNGQRWRATADFLIEWHSTYDPEVIDRQRFPHIERSWDRDQNGTPPDNP